MLNRCLLLSQRFFSKMAKLLKGIFPSGNFPIVNIPSGNFPIVYIRSGNFPIVYILSGNFPVVYIRSGNFPIVYIPSGNFRLGQGRPSETPKAAMGPDHCGQNKLMGQTLQIWENVTWENTLGKLPLGKILSWVDIYWI